MLKALLRALVRAGVSPFAESGLDETFGFAISARSVRTGEVMAQAQLDDNGAESAGTIAVTIIGEQATNGDTQGLVVSNGGVQEGDGGSGGKGGEDLGEGDAGVVIDGDVKVLPAAVKLAAAASIGTNHNAGEASQLLNIEVEQIARGSVLITDQRRSRLQIAHAVQTQAAKNATDGSAAQASSLGNVEAGEALAPQLFHALRQRLPGTTWRTMRSGREIMQTRPPSC
jgi:hypothetical protein